MTSKHKSCDFTESAGIKVPYPCEARESVSGYNPRCGFDASVWLYLEGGWVAVCRGHYQKVKAGREERIYFRKFWTSPEEAVRYMNIILTNYEPS